MTMIITTTRYYVLLPTGYHFLSFPFRCVTLPYLPYHFYYYFNYSYNSTHCYCRHHHHHDYYDCDDVLYNDYGYNYN